MADNAPYLRSGKYINRLRKLFRAAYFFFFGGGELAVCFVFLFCCFVLFLFVFFFMGMVEGLGMGMRLGVSVGIGCNFLNYPFDLFMTIHKPWLWRGRIFCYFSPSL